MTKYYFLIGLIVLSLAAQSSSSDTKPTIINGTVTLADSAAHEQMLMSSVRIGKVPVVDGQPDLARFNSGCSGTITGKSQVATAAHCFSGPDSSWIYYVEVRTSINPDKRKLIRASSLNTAKDVKDIMNETGKDPKKRGLDLATLTLDGEVDVRNIAPICGPQNVKTDSEYVVAGFGATATEKKSNDLLHTSVKMQQVNEGTFFSKPNRDQEIAAAACYGDSGGGLFIQEKDRKKACLAGTVSGNDQPPASGTAAELCMRPNLRQIFARATADSFKGLKTEKVFDPNPKAPPTQGSPGSQGTLPPGDIGDDAETGKLIK